MGLNFSKPSGQSEYLPEGQGNSEIQAAAEYDIVAEKEQMKRELVNSPKVDALVSTIVLDDPETIVSFGAEVAEEISKASDIVLQNVNMSQINDAGTLLTSLGKIMEKFDIDEIKNEDTGFFNKLFGNLSKSLDKIISKYNTMGDDVQKIYVELKRYESEIKEANRKLDQLFEANVNYYHQLVEYILAGEQGCRELDEYIEQRRSYMQETGDNSIQFEIQNLEQSKILLEQRTQDLRTAESVALQSIPMIQTMEMSNVNLVRKINSAFIITLPVFKQALAQAVMLKRQKIQADAMAVLDQKTNEMLVKNAQNTVDQAKYVAQLASGSSIKIETLETTWKTIVSGIGEMQQIQENAQKKREEDKARLENIKAEFVKMYHKPDNN